MALPWTIFSEPSASLLPSLSAHKQPPGALDAGLVHLWSIHSARFLETRELLACFQTWNTSVVPQGPRSSPTDPGVSSASFSILHCASSRQGGCARESRSSWG